MEVGNLTHGNFVALIRQGPYGCFHKLGPFLWVSLQYQPYNLVPMLVPLSFGNSHMSHGQVSFKREYAEF